MWLVIGLLNTTNQERRDRCVAVLRSAAHSPHVGGVSISQLLTDMQVVVVMLLICRLSMVNITQIRHMFLVRGIP